QQPLAGQSCGRKISLRTHQRSRVVANRSARSRLTSNAITSTPLEMRAMSVMPAQHTTTGGTAGESPATAILSCTLPEVYDELRHLAALYLRRERRGHTLQPTAIVHEAFLRLSRQQTVGWHNRLEFFRVAAQAMRRVLVDHARGAGATKRG